MPLFYDIPFAGTGGSKFRITEIAVTEMLQSRSFYEHLVPSLSSCKQSLL